MIKRAYYLTEETDCIMCGKTYVPVKDHNSGADPFYVNNFCSKGCVDEMDKFEKDFDFGL